MACAQLCAFAREPSWISIWFTTKTKRKSKDRRTPTWTALDTWLQEEIYLYNAKHMQAGTHTHTVRVYTHSQMFTSVLQRHRIIYYDTCCSFTNTWSDCCWSFVQLHDAWRIQQRVLLRPLSPENLSIQSKHSLPNSSVITHVLIIITSYEKKYTFVKLFWRYSDEL